MQNAECKMQNDEIAQLKFKLDSMRVKYTDLEDEANELRKEIEQKNAYIHNLEGRVEAFEFCIKNGRGK